MEHFIKLFNVCIVFVLAGCLNIEIETFIGANGNGSSIIHYWTDIDLLYRDTSSSNIFSFNKKIIKNNFVSDGVEVKSIDVWENPSDTSYHAEIKIVFDDINKLNNTPFFKDYRITLKDGASGQKIFEQTIKSSKFSGLELKKYKLKYIYHFPGNIVTDNADEKVANTLIWHFTLGDLEKDKTLIATFKVPQSDSFIYFLPFLILFLVVLWIFIFLKKLKSKVEK